MRKPILPSALLLLTSTSAHALSRETTMVFLYVNLPVFCQNRGHGLTSWPLPDRDILGTCINSVCEAETDQFGVGQDNSDYSASSPKNIITNAKPFKLCSMAFGPLLLYPQKLVCLKRRAKTWLQSHCSNSREDVAAAL